MLKLKTNIDSREYCFKCFRAKINCLCNLIKPFLTNIRFVILMHGKEARKQKIGTGRLANLCLENSEIIIGQDFSNNFRVNSLLNNKNYYPLVLFPGNDSIKFNNANDQLHIKDKNLLVFVVDGTWSSVKQILKNSKNLSGLKKISFSREYESQFIIKKQPKKYCLSTIEAIYYLIEESEKIGLENIDGKQNLLMKIFKKIVSIQIKHMNEKNHKCFFSV